MEEASCQGWWNQNSWSWWQTQLKGRKLYRLTNYTFKVQYNKNTTVCKGSWYLVVNRKWVHEWCDLQSLMNQFASFQRLGRSFLTRYCTFNDRFSLRKLGKLVQLPIYLLYYCMWKIAWYLILLEWSCLTNFILTDD